MQQGECCVRKVETKRRPYWDSNPRPHDYKSQAVPTELLRCVMLAAATTMKATCTKLLALLAHSENSTSGRFDCATNLSRKYACTNERNLARTRDNYAETVLIAFTKPRLDSCGWQQLSRLNQQHSMQRYSNLCN